MIEIKISDPASCKPAELRLVANLLLTLAGACPHPETIVDEGCAGCIAPETAAHPQLTPGMVGTIAPEDSPAAGTDAAAVFAGNANPAEVFAGCGIPPHVFADTQPAQLGNALPVDASISSPANSAPGIASIPVAPASAAPGSVASVELDKNGLPWDARIHASTKAMNVDKTWRTKRGVDPALVTQVEAELRAVLGVSAFPTTTAGALGIAGNVPPVPVATVTEPVISTATPIAAVVSIAPVELGNVPPPPPPAPGAQVSTVAPLAVPVAAIPDTVPSAPAPISFPQLCAKITNALNTGTLTQARLGEVLGENKLSGLPTLAAFPQLVGPVAAALGFA